MSSYGKLSPYARSEEIANYGHHRNEQNFWSEFRDDHCPPGTENKVLRPFEERIRTVSGWESPENKSASATGNLLREYDTLRAQGKVRAKGVGHEPGRWEYQWPEAVCAKAQEMESRGLSREPFLNLLLEPIKRRPKTFGECVDFFYPMSGMVPPALGISPFVSTSVHAYYVPENNTSKAGDIPLRLGEVSMMYGWYLAFRTILCPDEAETAIDALIKSQRTNINEEFPFLPTSAVVSLDDIEAARMRGNIEEDVKLLSRIGVAVQLLEYGANALATGKFELPSNASELMEGLQDALGDLDMREALSKYGTAAVASMLNNTLELPYEHANDLATLVTKGAISPEKFTKLFSTKNLNNDDLEFTRTAAQNIYDGYVKEKISNQLAEGSPLRNNNLLTDATDLLREYYITGQIDPNLESKYRESKNTPPSQRDNTKKLIVQAYEARKAELEVLAEKKLNQVADFAQFGARKNPVAVLAPLAVSAVSAAIQGGLDYSQAKYLKDLRSIYDYLKDHLFRIDPNIATSDIVFELGDHVRRGVWKSGRWTWKGWQDGNWQSSRLRPDCLLQQGGQVLDYWTHVWSRIRSIVHKFQKYKKRIIADNSLEYYSQMDRYGFGGFTPLLADAESSSGIHRVVYSCDNLPNILRDGDECNGENFSRPMQETYFRENDQVKRGHTRCQGLGILADNVDHSIFLVLDNLDSFSPFTHAYGFAPTFERIPASGGVVINGIAPRRFLGPDTSTNMVYKNHKNQLRASAAPGRLYPRADLNLANSYGIVGVECYLGTSPLPSRRLLEGAYGQRCNISFDVGIDSRVPVMDAQFCGLMACLLLHPEALETCRKFGFSWAQDTWEKKNVQRAQLLSRMSPELFNIKLPLLNKSFISPHALTDISKLKLTPFLNTAAVKTFDNKNVIKFTPALKKSMQALTKSALLDNMKINPNILNALKPKGTTLKVQKHTKTKAAQKAELSTTQKVVGAVTVTAVTAGLSYVVYKVYKAGK